MSWIGRLRNLVYSARHGHDLDRELDFHIAERADDLAAHGMERGEAERQARIQFGHRQGIKEETREIGIIGWLESVGKDLRYAVRGLRANPGFTATVVLSLALGIGANTAIFSLLNAVLLKSLPVVDPGQLVQLTTGEDRGAVFTNPIWEEVRRRQNLFSGMFALADESFNLAEGGEARTIDGDYIGGDLFATLGLVPAAGRLIGGADDYRGCPPVVVIGHGFWQSEFAGAASAIGRSISLDGHPFQIVGVAPAGFFGVEVGRSAQLHVPLCAEAIIQGGNSGLDERARWWLQILGRPRPALLPAEVGAGLAALSGAVFAAAVPGDLDATNRQTFLGMQLQTRPAATGLSDLRSRYRPALMMLMTVVGLVLLIACSNVANLLMARGTVRRRETAMRLALGAGRGRLVRQMLTESLMLSLLGAALGFLMAIWGSRLLVRMLAGQDGGVWLDLSVDYRLLGFTIGIAVITAVLFGLVPAYRTSRVDPQAALRAHVPGIAEGGRRFSLGKALVLAQVALSLVLVLGAALLLTTFHTLATLDPGFRREGLLAIRMDLSAGGYPDARLTAIHDQTLERLRVLPGVQSAASAFLLPISGYHWILGIHVPGRPDPEDFRDRVSWFNRVSGDYFTTMGTELIGGREFGPGDVAGSVPVAVISEGMARKFFPAGSPLGKLFIAESGMGQTTYEVIGIAKDSRYRSLRDQPEPIVYVSDAQMPRPERTVNFLVRTGGDPVALMPSIRNAVGEIDARASFTTLSVEESLDRSLARERLLATLSGIFGALALVLALLGQYGLMSYSVARRRNEIGIRLALGAERRGVVRLILGEVGRLVTMGVVVGLAAALAAGHLVTAFLYGVSATDPATIIATIGMVALVGMVAGAIPAWRAARLDPVTALRED